MPIFVLRCVQCRHTVEVLRRAQIAAQVMDEHPEPCPKCGAPMKRIPTACAAIFPEGRGGFYKPSKGAGAEEEK